MYLNNYNIVNYVFGSLCVSIMGKFFDIMDSSLYVDLLS